MIQIIIETIIQEIERIFKRDKTYKKRARRSAALFFLCEPPQARKPFFKRASALETFFRTSKKPRSAQPSRTRRS